MLERVTLDRPFVDCFPLFRGRPHAFFLDGEAADGGFSAMGAEPFTTFRASRIIGSPRATITVDGVTTEGDAFEALRALLASRAHVAASPLPFTSGAVGYFGYGAGWMLEALPEIEAARDGMPDIAFGLYDTMLLHEHRTGATYVSAPTTEKRDALLARLFARTRSATRSVPRSGPFEPWIVDRAPYEALVRQALEHIAAGDAYELCLTHTITAAFDGASWDLFRALRAINPAPFASYLELPEGTIVSSSPERFLKLGADRIAESRPIKGTRPRGQTRDEDEALEHDLRTSAKDNAENTMIVDLVRNDLGRVCRFGSVTVPEFRIVERHPTVHQMVSTIRGELRDDCDAIDLVRAAFPPGSMTGAPKIEAMKILGHLEGDRRGVYAGAIGYLDFAGAIDLAVTIRTIVLAEGVAHVGVGGAIVADSVPSDEYEETLHKARAPLEALRWLSASRTPAVAS